MDLHAKVIEILKAGADMTVTDLDGKGPEQLATKQELLQARHECHASV
jgi:hypothetical protein